MDSKTYDYVLVGGGLQTGLLVLALRAHRPKARMVVLEREDRLGGNHTWCVHHHDLSESQRQWCEPLFGHRWPGYDVEFPNRSRRIEQPYAAVHSADFHRVIAATIEDAPGSTLRLGSEVAEVDARHARLADGAVVEGELVLDARGQTGGVQGTGFQKFLGQELELHRPHGLERPLLMDARVEQLEGFRFLYLLPFAPTRLLVEDTRFSDTPDVDRAHYREEIDRYLRGRGWSAERVLREEVGVLPMPWSSPAVDVEQRPLAVGTRGGWFHPATGYSFPVAARLAETIARGGSNSLQEGLDALGRRHERQATYARFLNRMLFRWYPPASRRWIFERFYGMPESTIARFYALQTTGGDRARLLLGRPPRGLSLRHRWSHGGGS